MTQHRNTSYNGNALIKSSGVPVSYTSEQITEWIKCRDNPVYFIEQYVKIITLDHGLQPMRLFEFQKGIVNGILTNNKVVSACCRQAGKTTVMAAIFCHYVIFNKDKVCAILANKAATAREILARVKLAYEHLPSWLQHGVSEWNKGSIQLENGSRILASSTSGDAIRGYSVNFLFLDEFAFIQNNIAEEFFTSVYPTISSGKNSKLAIISTPNGMNHFYKLWIESQEGTNGFLPIMATWKDIPGRDQKWADEQRAVLGDQKFSQELEVQFLGASNTLINGAKLKSIPFIKPELSNSTTSVYEKPQSGHSYCITADTSRGTGNDYSAFLIFDVSSFPYRVVFKYSSNTISSLLYPSVIHKAAVEYNQATVLIESNDVGEGVAHDLYFDFEYENCIFSKDGEIAVWSGRGSTPGVRTTTKTKRIGCDILKQLIESDKLIINDYEILMELSNFVAKGKSYEADTGHDDLVMCLVMFAYLTTSGKFADISDISFKERLLLERAAHEEQEMLPVGFLNDGTQSDEPVEVLNF